MTAYGGLIAKYEYKGRSHARVTYNKTSKLANITLAGDVELTLTLRADQLAALSSDVSRALAAMLEDTSSIGYDTLEATNSRGIDRLEHLADRLGLAPQGGINE